MEHFNEVFFHKKEARKLLLFILIKNAPIQGIQVNELVKKYPCSRKTMYSDLIELKQDLIYVYNQSLLKEYTKGTFFLENKKNSSRQKLVLYYVKKSRDFWVFHTIAKHKNISLTTLKENLYYSQSTIYESTKKLHKKLQPLAIACSTAGLIGNEKKIRHLLFESYWSLFGGIEWPFKLKRELVEIEIQSLEQTGIIFNHLEKEKMLYWLAITEIRLSIGKRIPNQIPKPFETKKNILHTFFEKCCANYYQDNYFEEESIFLIRTFQSFFDISLYEEERINKKVVTDVPRIENELILKGEKLSLEINEMVDLKKSLAKINYYVEEKIIDWYHFLELNAKIYFQENMDFIEKEWTELLEELPVELRSIYMLEAKKNGITLTKPLRIRLLSKEGKALEIGQFFKKYSLNPIEIIQQRDAEYDVLITNFLVSSKKNELNVEDIFYEWPLTQKELKDILEKANSLRKSY
ncbi:helix-turn-helix domain-containing protein [Carnobacterium maltaromaticum]|uniref:helix-turn-helix domain-containing protein n=1 Tax=Carnobacterium maltaromaticum TaxID=2751 RepID=UPI00107176F0|nr:helix-turn-helix domain-containing protein [Carnobacterium maltaromaticum]TFJ76590.1 hypothetical protein CKN94_01910 [Carnobacterium maltaromaticum]TFJ79390.1 hypothetical protein CKN97_01905 [Carnobacterium maltaromaticum]